MPTELTNTPPHLLYAELREELITTVAALADNEALTVVPLSPDWTVKDVVAHVCGINDDLVNGRLEGIGSDAWTAAQVASRASMSLADICAEWRGLAEKITEIMTADPFLGIRLIADLTIHLNDVQHAINQPIDTNSEATIVAAHRYVPHLQDRVAERLDLGITVELSDGTAWLSSLPDAIVLRTTPYDFLRSVSGRRSRNQVESLDWSRDPAAILASAWTAYGPLRTDDVAV